MSHDLVERIYEAALAPEGWPGVLDVLGAISGSAGGAMFVTTGRHPPKWVASEPVAAALDAFTESGAWRRNRRRERWAENIGGFYRDVDIFTPQELAEPDFRTHGLGFQLGTVIPMPTGEQVIVSLERRRIDGPHHTDANAAVDRVRPHLARAGLLAARLGLERARTAVTTLEAVGLPAAVLTASGRALVVNDLLEASSPDLLKPKGHGGMAVADAAADRLFQQAVAEARGRRFAVVQSIPVAATERRGAAVIHVLPVRGAVADIFSGATLLVVVTSICMAEGIPDLTLLRGLFDLSPKEARLAAGLAAGRTLQEVAATENIRFRTARSYLEAVFRKTGTHQQSQLVALLKSAHPLGSAPPAP